MSMDNDLLDRSTCRGRASRLQNEAAKRLAAIREQIEPLERLLGIEVIEL